MSVQPGFRGLEVWQIGRRLANDVFVLTKTFPRDEAYGLTSQIRRASVSIPSNIAEGWARQSAGAFANHLRIARASLSELHTQLILSCDFGYISPDELASVEASLDNLGRKLYNQIVRAGDLNVREDLAQYAATEPLA